MCNILGWDAGQQMAILCCCTTAIRTKSMERIMNVFVGQLPTLAVRGVLRATMRLAPTVMISSIGFQSAVRWRTMMLCLLHQMLEEIRMEENSIRQIRCKLNSK
jgi:hypothetical protein